MTPSFPTLPASLRGMALLNTPAFNKGTAFTAEERDRLGLHGLLPPQVETLAEQLVRAYEAFQQKPTALERHIYLRALQDTNEVLFYRLLLEHLEEMMPVVYTPVVAEGCARFSHIYRRPRGLFLSYPMRARMRELLRNRPFKEVDIIVVTDGERILGIGDQGVGGLGIPIGKLTLYSLVAGIHPERSLPIVLDVGTNDPRLLADPEYLGWRHERITGTDYEEFIESFVAAVQTELPDTCVQWEDFATQHARPILERYRHRLLSFNDDIQGTAAVALGAILAAVTATGGKLASQRLVFLGAGSAGIGVADYLRAALVAAGLSEAEARSRFWLVDKDGLLHDGRTDLSPEQLVYAQPLAHCSDWPRSQAGQIGLAEVVAKVRPTILIGLSTVPGAFDESLVRRMASAVERPIIFPLSNPTERAEARPEDLLRWTEGRALVATGSPFAPVVWQGRQVPISQCNNVYIFPAVGLGVVAARARRVSDGMLLAAARALAACSPATRDPYAAILPPLTAIREVTIEVAVAVGAAAQAEGLAPPSTREQLRAAVLNSRWEPDYPVI